MDTALVDQAVEKFNLRDKKATQNIKTEDMFYSWTSILYSFLYSLQSHRFEKMNVLNLLII